MKIAELVNMLCEAVDAHSENFQPEPSVKPDCLTVTGVAERTGGITCTLHLTPSGEISAEPTGCLCAFCIRPKTLNAKPAE